MTTTSARRQISARDVEVKREALIGYASTGHFTRTCDSIAQEIKELQELDVQLAVVIGAAISSVGLQDEARTRRTTGDYMGMLATVIKRPGASGRVGEEWRPHRVQSPSRCAPWPNRSSPSRECDILRRAAWLFSPPARATRIFRPTPPRAARKRDRRGRLLKATKSKGIHRRSEKDPTATKYEQTHLYGRIERALNVMDSTAFSLCMDNRSRSSS